MAMAGRTQDRCRGTSSVHGTDDTADHHGRQFDVRSRAVRSRSGMSDDTGRGQWLTLSWRRPRHVDEKSVWAGAGPMAGAAARRSADRGDPPYDARERDSLNQSRTIGSNFRDRNSSSDGTSLILSIQKSLFLCEYHVTSLRSNEIDRGCFCKATAVHRLLKVDGYHGSTSRKNHSASETCWNTCGLSSSRLD
jgi:hypothetical protein